MRLSFRKPRPEATAPMAARASAAALEAVRLPPPQFRWKSCLGCGTVQQIILASTKPSRCTRCGRSPFES